MSTSTTSSCQAANPSTCCFHGNVARLEKKMQEASIAGDFNAYEKARDELEALNTHKDFIEAMETRQGDED